LKNAIFGRESTKKAQTITAALFSGTKPIDIIGFI